MIHIHRTRTDRCPACGAANAACGAPSDAVPVDARMEVAVVGGPLRKYRVVTASGHETVIKYNDSDAERAGLTDADLIETPAALVVPVAPAVKAATARSTARTGSANKARTGAQNKAAKPRGSSKPPAKLAASAPPPEQVPPADPGDGGQDPAADSGVPAEPAPPADGG